MKPIILLASLLTSLTLTTAYASNIPTKPVELPFHDQPLHGADYSGLSFNFDLTNSSFNGITCIFNSVNKAWIEFPDQGAKRATDAYTHHKMVVFSTTIKINISSDAVDHFHIDPAGNIVINEAYSEGSAPGTVSCFYFHDK